MSGQQRPDLLVLVADKNTQYSLQGLLRRPWALGIREISRQFHVHPKRDPGVFGQCHTFLRPLQKLADYALVVCDREGCGRESHSPRVLEVEMETRLAQSGWEHRSAAVVIDPELEAWLRTDSPEVPLVLGWSRERLSLTDWLVHRGYLQPGESKPMRPKEALEELLRIVKKPRSSSLYGELAEKVDFEYCSDPAFAKLKT